MTAQLAWCQLGTYLKNREVNDLWSLSGADSSSGSEQTKFVITARAMGTPGVSSLIISTVG